LTATELPAAHKMGSKATGKASALHWTRLTVQRKLVSE
jgi:hypothetical protein